MSILSNPLLLYRLRMLVLALGTAAIVYPPAYRQLGGTNDTLHRWSMYKELGRDVCIVEFRRRLEGGGEVLLDRWAELGKMRPRGSVERLIRNSREAGEVATRLCARFGEGADVRVTLRCGGNNGWESILDGSEPMCPH